MSSFRPQVMRPEDNYTMNLKLLEALLSKRLYNAFRWLKWKGFIDVQKLSSRLPPLPHHVFKTFLSQLQVIEFEVV